MNDDNRFWAAIERIETDYVADLDRPRFRRRMKRKGFDAATIEERIAGIDEHNRPWRHPPV